MKTLLLTCSLLFALLAPAYTQQPQAPLGTDPGEDQFQFCKQLYRQANGLRVQYERVLAYQRLIPRLNNYIQRFPKHKNTPAATYYLGESYYHSGSIDDAKRVLLSSIHRYKTGRYVALASNRLGYDAYTSKKYAQAAIHFERLSRLSTTLQEKNRGAYQAAASYRLSKQPAKAIALYKKIEANPQTSGLYRENSRLRLAHLYKEAKENQKALTKFEELIKPGVAKHIYIESALNAGLLAMQLEKNDIAQRYFKIVLLSKEGKYKATAQAALMSCLYNTKDYQAVLDIVKRGSYPGPKTTEATKFTLAGRSAYQLKQYHNAIKLFAQAERQIPLSAQAFEAGYYRLLCFYNIEGANIPAQVGGFLEIYQKSYPKHQWIHKALFMSAETLFDQSKWRPAAAAYNQIDSSLVGEANRPGLLYKRGWCLAESGDHNGAMRSFTDFISRYPEDSRISQAIAKRGQSYLSLGDRASALKDFDLLIEKFPKEKLAALAWQNSARICKDDQNYPEMIRRYRALLKNFPNLRQTTQANARYWLGWACYQTEQYKLAIPALEKAIALDADRYAFQSNMLIVYSSYTLKDKTRLEQAVADVTKLGKAEKIQSPIYRWLGVQCFNGGDMKGTAKHLSLGVTPMDPLQTPKAYWKILGHARVQIGDNKRALEATNNFLKNAIKPFNIVEAQLDKARAHLGLNQILDAKAAATAGLNLRPQGRIGGELRVILGDIAFAQKNFPEAAAAYVVASQFFVNDKELRPEVLYKANQALLKKGDAKQAQHYLDTLNKEFPNYLKKK